MTIYNGYIQDPIWKNSTYQKTASSFATAVNILSYMLLNLLLSRYVQRAHFF